MEHPVYLLIKPENGKRYFVTVTFDVFEKINNIQNKVLCNYCFNKVNLQKIKILRQFLYYCPKI